MHTIKGLRAHAISQTFFRPTTLRAAINRLGFVQADPIRSPARAQDLILRHRVEGYRVGDLERQYPMLNLEEDRLYAHGFIPRATQQLLYPRKVTKLSKFEEKILETIRRRGRTHPRELDKEFGHRRAINGWGGYSKATKVALDNLHRRGLLRIAGRENGIRIYELPSPQVGWRSPTERLRQLIRVITKILAPIQIRTLQANLARYKYLGNTQTTLDDMFRSGELERHDVEGLTYVWPREKVTCRETSRRVRFLTPFDPLVWDRRRFEHLWGWPYRFEAYTPKAKRLRGYYAMPLLWDNRIIGWTNINVVKESLNVELGFIEKRPEDANFKSELAAEIESMRTFLKLNKMTE